LTSAPETRTQPQDATSQLVLLRYSGDLTTKAPATRRRFTDQLLRNLRDAADAEGATLKLRPTRDRIFAELFPATAAAALARVFGVQSLSLVEARPWQNLSDLVEAGVELFADAVEGKRFAVRARRVGERQHIAVDSGELERTLGARLFPRANGVDLNNPEVAVRIEVMPKQAYFFTHTLAGRGGLPLGAESNAIALASGGFDSVVAAWQLLKRGVELDYVLCNLGGRSQQVETLRVLKLIADRWSYGTKPRLHVVDFDPVSQDIQKHTQMRYWQVVLKRLMLRAGEAVASERAALALVTGDAVGQVSSQTLQNLNTISAATTLPILRPLVGSNKEEILAVARDIGTYEASSQVNEYCAIVPSKPATHATLPAILSEESRLDPALLERAVAERSVFDMRNLDLAAFELPELRTDRIPEGAVLLDLRSKAAFDTWHYEGALNLEFSNALRAYGHFERKQAYVLVCEFGLKSAHLADLMRREGFEASHFAGGLPELRRYAARD
jgi:thiamine biosynthesis protein ThiI